MLGGGPVASPTPAPVVASAPVLSDADQVWNTLHNESNCINQAELLAYLEELGISSKEDLGYIDEASQAKLVTYLKKVQASKVTVLLNRLRSQAM